MILPLADGTPDLLGSFEERELDPSLHAVNDRLSDALGAAGNFHCPRSVDTPSPRHVSLVSKGQPARRKQWSPDSLHDEPWATVFRSERRFAGCIGRPAPH
jgi:hypothetical protein